MDRGSKDLPRSGDRDQARVLLRDWPGHASVAAVGGSADVSAYTSGDCALSGRKGREAMEKDFGWIIRNAVYRYCKGLLLGAVVVAVAVTLQYVLYKL